MAIMTPTTTYGNSTSYTDVFQVWCNNGSATSGTTTTNVWETWITEAVDFRTNVTRRVETNQEMLKFRAEHEQRQREKAEIAKREWEEVSGRAKALLLSNLTVTQQEEWNKKNKITVIGNSSHLKYEILNGRAHNIFRLNKKGQRVAEFCVHVEDGVPNEDNVLSQKLMLENAENILIGMANKRELIAA